MISGRDVSPCHDMSPRHAMPSCHDMSSYHDMSPCHAMPSCHDASSCHDMSSCYDMSSCLAMASCHDMSTSHAVSESQKLSRLILDALTVPDALVNATRILEISGDVLYPTKPSTTPNLLPQINTRIHPLDFHNPVRNAPRSAGDAPGASGVAKT